MNFLYLFINFASLIVPLVFSFHPKLQFHKKWKYLWPAIVITTLVFIPWDIYFTEKGVWGFDPDYLSGIFFYNLPIEEVLFFICIPYSCLFTYHCLEILIKNQASLQTERLITLSLLVFLLSAGLISLDKMYTSVTFFSLASLIIFLKFIFKVNWLNRFYFSYLILLIPFTIVNGILTGTGLEKPIVWYNDAENMGVRLLTIPFEDIFYGMLLILLNISIFEYLGRKHES